MRAVCAILFLAVAPTVAFAAPVVRYEVVFDATWSAETHPQDFPAGAHFSPPVGGSHTKRAVFWAVGELASAGIERMAELGQTSTLVSEIGDEAALGNASPDSVVGNGIQAPGTTSLQVEMTRDFPLLTLVTMIAPSPDWFTGIAGLELLQGGRWRDSLVVRVIAYDSGTDSGSTYTSPDADTDPAEPISVIGTPPLADSNGYAPPVGTYSFTILSVDGLPPYDDTDGDGLSNVSEAALGTSVTEPDTDFDGSPDGDDNCPLLANASQADGDADGVGEACDNCPTAENASQEDADADGEGDRCDLDDGLLWFTEVMPVSLTWQDDVVYDEFNLYRADLAVLRAGGPYTQDPTAPNAERSCGLAEPTASASYSPPTGAGVYYLVSGVSGGVEGSIGQRPDGTERPNDHPCP